MTPLKLMALYFISFGELSNIIENKVKESSFIRMEKVENRFKMIFINK